MTKEMYADSLMGIQIAGEVIKLDFASHVVHEGPNPPPELKEGEDPPQVVRQRIVMPISGFAQAFGVQETIINKLVDDGVLQRTEAEKTVPAKEETAPKNFPKH